MIAEKIAEDDGLDGAPSRDTVFRILSAPQVPAKLADVLALAAVLARDAAWSVDDAVQRVRNLWVQARQWKPLGVPIGNSLDPFALEVHPAIEAEPADGVGDGFLPAYVERGFDTGLRARVRQAVRGDSQLVVLVGGSSTGKTRACWEALQELPSTWRVWHPIDPSPPEAVLRDASAVGPNTVVWLNEIQRYLLTSSSDLGERAAASLRTLLSDADRGPVLVLGTMWPEHWAALTEPASRSGPDPHAQARQLLMAHSIRVPDAFTRRDLAVAQPLAVMDARLRQALEHAEQAQITQYLAGGPALLERYRDAPDGARALIEAAMDCRRLGYGPDLPLVMLEEAAEGYLTQAKLDLLDEDWVARALSYATEPVRGARAPLTAPRPRRGEKHAPAQSVRLADYLEQHGRQTRCRQLPPATVWETFLAHAAAGDKVAMGTAAQERGLLRTAAQLFTAAAEAGYATAMRLLGDLLAQSGRVDEALVWFDLAFEAGDPEAPGWAANTLYNASRFQEALVWFDRAVSVGDHLAARTAGQMLEYSQHDLDAALPWYQRAADTQDPGALGEAADSLWYADRPEEALQWYLHAADVGNTYALLSGAKKLRRAGRLEEALDWYQRAAGAGHTKAYHGVASLLQQLGRGNEVLPWLSRFIDEGDVAALSTAAWAYEQMGQVDEAFLYYKRAAHAGDRQAMYKVAEQLAGSDRIDEAVAWYDRARDAGDDHAWSWAAETLWKAGRVDEALERYQRAYDAGDHNAFTEAASFLIRRKRTDALPSLQKCALEAGDADLPAAVGMLLDLVGRTDEAIAWLRGAVDAQHPRAEQELVRLLEKSNQNEEATARANVHAAQGHTWAIKHIAGTLSQADHLNEALNWYQRAATAGDAFSQQRVADLLAATGRLDEALPWYEKAADADDARALRVAARHLAGAERYEDAQHYLRLAAEGGDKVALSRAVDMLNEAGQTETGHQLRQYGWESDGSVAPPWRAQIPTSLSTTQQARYPGAEPPNEAPSRRL
ncbi:tetratricopeptide repeat protein [Streptacidiphilus sp. EB103A]|uniref:tetratricopeptide repeat protein n=1 Tax=Streptacidiphilus sp. EB103A TaxID=3156275 RepID=UPI00351704E3